MELTTQSPFSQRLLAYLNERFPLVRHGVLIISYYSSNQFLAQALEYKDTPLHYSINSLFGAITIFCMFFHLRVFDEHKDYKDDIKYYPNRILSKGIITLKTLKIMGFIAITIEFIVSFHCGIAALTSTLIAFLFSLLMLKEFFMGEWLKRHFVVYASTHMLIMPLFALTAYSFTTGKFLWEAPSWFLLYGFVGFFVTFNWEVSRKIRAPEDEIKGVGSYSRIFGTYGAAYLVILIRVIDTGLVYLVGYHLGLSLFFYLILAILFMVCLAGLLQFRFQTNRKTAKRMETYAGVYIIAFDLTLAVEILRMNSIEF
jgi:4-hydroxybenzoate polyprenyltransferase